MVEIKIREIGINDDRRTEVFAHSFEIVGADGRGLYRIGLSEDGALEVSAGTPCKHNGRRLESQLCVRPYSTNVVYISRDEHKG